jgi:hypothetical protein
MARIRAECHRSAPAVVTDVPGEAIRLTLYNRSDAAAAMTGSVDA